MLLLLDGGDDESADKTTSVAAAGATLLPERRGDGGSGAVADRRGDWPPVDVVDDIESLGCDAAANTDTSTGAAPPMR
jgi:hypothetical protein